VEKEAQMVVVDGTSMSTSAADPEEAGRRKLLSDFLRDRRKALKPEDVGLPASRGARRVAGLRREEVAVLADLGITWYTWLEQGRPIRIAPATLDRIANALRLDRHERAYLNLLVFGNAAPPAWSATLLPNLVEVVRSYSAGPAYVLGPRWDVLAWNDVFERVFHFPGALSENRNALRHTFLNAAVPELFVDWPVQARSIIAAFRVSYAGHVGDSAFEALVAELTAQSPLFAELWRESEVLSPTEGRSAKLRDTATHLLTYSGVTLLVPDYPETTVVFGRIEDAAT
jgi:transcriptional regulator with XRE-family HTH domain